MDRGEVTADVVLAQYSNFGSSVDVSAPGGQSFADANGDGIGDGVLSTVGLSLDASELCAVQRNLDGSATCCGCCCPHGIGAPQSHPMNLTRR